MTELSTQPVAPPDSHQVDGQLLRGIAWTGGAKWVVQLLSWASLIVLARLLTPNDFGVVGLAAVYLGFIGMITEAGLGTAILALPDLGRDRIAQLNSVALIFGVVGTAVTAAGAIPFGRFFRSPELPLVMVAMSVTFLLAAIRTVPTALLQKELRFRELGLIETFQAFVAMAAGVVLAFVGLGYWALVWSNVGAMAVGTAVLFAVRPHGFAIPRAAPLRGALGFSGRVLVNRVSWYLYSNADFAVAGRMLGTATLGIYKQAWEIASVPVDKIAALVTRVTPAFVSRLQADTEALRRTVLRITEGLLLVTLPASVGMALVADHFIPVALGPKWTDAALPLALLSIFASFRSLVTILPQVLTVRGEARLLMWNGIFTAILLPVAFWIGSRWGAAGIAAAWIVAYPWSTVQLYRRTARTLELGVRDYLVAVWPAIRGTIVMAPVVVAARVLLPDSVPLTARLGIEVAAGAVAYLAAGVLPQRERFKRLVELVRGR
jgi:PST family polysaccharide transporter